MACFVANSGGWWILKPVYIYNICQSGSSCNPRVHVYTISLLQDSITTQPRCRSAVCPKDHACTISWFCSSRQPLSSANFTELSKANSSTIQYMYSSSATQGYFESWSLVNDKDQAMACIVTPKGIVESYSSIKKQTVIQWVCNSGQLTSITSMHMAGQHKCCSNYSKLWNGPYSQATDQD